MFAQSANAIIGIRICVAVIPIVAALIALYLLKKFKMTKEDHNMIRAAIATRRKYGSVTLTEEEIRRCELISGQKYENTWLGQGNDSNESHTLETDEDGNYTILAENSKEESK